MPYGLLPPLRPGRPPGALGPPGRGADGATRGGIAVGAGFGATGPAAGASCGAGCLRCRAAFTVASCSAFRAAARASAAATSMSCALAGLIAGPPADAGGVGTGRAGRFCGVGLAGAFGAPALSTEGGGAGVLAVDGLATNTCRSRRATGASTVLDADLTNSPISLSLARTTLLSTPSSFASSCTRALPATALLTPRPHGQVTRTTSLVHLKPGHFCDFIVCSCRSSYLAVRVRHQPHQRWFSTTPVRRVCSARRPRAVAECLEVLDQRTGVEDAGDAQRAPEGAAALR